MQPVVQAAHLSVLCCSVLRRLPVGPPKRPSPAVYDLPADTLPPTPDESNRRASSRLISIVRSPRDSISVAADRMCAGTCVTKRVAGEDRGGIV